MNRGWLGATREAGEDRRAGRATAPTPPGEHSPTGPAGLQQASARSPSPAPALAQPPPPEVPPPPAAAGQPGARTAGAQGGERSGSGRPSVAGGGRDPWPAGTSGDGGALNSARSGGSRPGASPRRALGDSRSMRASFAPAALLCRPGTTMGGAGGGGGRIMDGQRTASGRRKLRSPSRSASRARSPAAAAASRPGSAASTVRSRRAGGRSEAGTDAGTDAGWEDDGGGGRPGLRLMTAPMGSPPGRDVGEEEAGGKDGKPIPAGLRINFNLQVGRRAPCRACAGMARCSCPPPPCGGGGMGGVAGGGRGVVAGHIALARPAPARPWKRGGVGVRVRAKASPATPCAPQAAGIAPPTMMAFGVGLPGRRRAADAAGPRTVPTGRAGSAMADISMDAYKRAVTEVGGVSRTQGLRF